MPHQTRISTLEYVLMAFVAILAVATLAAALWPMVELISDGFRIIGQALNGTFVPLK
jgi:hypothetical protein